VSRGGSRSHPERTGWSRSRAGRPLGGLEPLEGDGPFFRSNAAFHLDRSWPSSRRMPSRDMQWAVQLSQHEAVPVRAKGSGEVRDDLPGGGLIRDSP